VLVASFDASILRSTGLEILQQLWAEDITGELATDARSAEDLLSKYRDDQHNWVVIVKQDLMLKVKSVGRRNASDVDLPLTQLLPWLRAEIREREQREGSSDRARLLRQPTQAETSDALTKEQEVRVLMAQTKSKKSNRLKIVESAHTHALSLVQSFLDGPILAIETSDHALGLIRETRLSDPDSWRKVSQSVPSAERRYIGEIHDVLKTLAVENKDLTRNAFVYNFRSGTCIYYDMGL
jgi:translation initiation factor 2-alpha kinase 4